MIIRSPDGVKTRCLVRTHREQELSTNTPHNVLHCAKVTPTRDSRLPRAQRLNQQRVNTEIPKLQSQTFIVIITNRMNIHPSIHRSIVIITNRMNIDRSIDRSIVIITNRMNIHPSIHPSIDRSIDRSIHPSISLKSTMTKRTVLYSFDWVSSIVSEQSSVKTKKFYLRKHHLQQISNKLSWNLEHIWQVQHATCTRMPTCAYVDIMWICAHHVYIFDHVSVFGLQTSENLVFLLWYNLVRNCNNN